jgi:hypothetical protein
MKIIDFIIILGFALIIFSIIIFISSLQLRKTKQILLKFKDYTLEKVKIRFLQSSIGKGAVVGGLSIKALMYLSDNFLIITPKEKGIFNGLFNFNLPVIMVKDENQRNVLGLNNLTVPDEIKLTSLNRILIKYHKNTISNVSYSIQISLQDKNDISKIDLIRNWC